MYLRPPIENEPHSKEKLSNCYVMPRLQPENIVITKVRQYLKSNYMNEVDINDNSFLRQFETKVDGHLAKIEYSSQERKVFLTKLVIPEEISREGFKEDFIKGVLHQIQDKNLRVVPTSPQIAGFLRKNRQYKEMLPVGIRI